MSASSAPFTCVTAFASKPFGGNPAAVVFLDTNTVSFDVLHGLALNFNQPVLSLVKPIDVLKAGETVIRTDIRFIAVTGKEIELCGHGSLAAAKALLALPAAAQTKVHEIVLRTRTKGVVSIRVIDGGLLEMELPTSSLEAISAEEEKRITALVNRAFSRDVKIKHIASGGDGFKHALLIEIDEKEDLASIKVDTRPFAETNYSLNTVTSSRSSTAEERFVSRMFSKEVPGGEDHVCGSAHCLLVPYWYEKSGIAPGSEVIAKQVSARGGLLNVVWAEDKATIKLRGDACILSTGVCYF